MRSLDRRALWGLAVAAAVVGLTLATLVIPEGRGRLLIYNGTPSVPLGFYRRALWQAVEPGVIVALTPPEAARALGWTEHTLFLKHVVAVAGGRYCITDRETTVEGVSYAPPQAESDGRPLPHPTGCATVPPGQVFVLNDVPQSFDSRYFGPVPVSLITGVYVPLWTFSNSH